MLANHNILRVNVSSWNCQEQELGFLADDNAVMGAQ